jgi:hypothetical protein
MSEWTSEPPNRTIFEISRLWRNSHRYKRQILSKRFDIGKVSYYIANEGGTTGLPSFLDARTLFILKAVLKVIVDLLTMLIGAEGARLLENAIAFPSCVGGFKDANSMSCGRTGQGRPRSSLSAEEAPRTARGK